MAESHDVKVNVDASQGKSELRSFTQAVGSATSKLEELRAAAASAGSGGFASLGNQIRQLSTGFNALKNVSGGVAAARELRSFSNAAASFKAPSSTQISNINSLSKALKQFENIKVSKFAGGDIANLAKGIGQIQVPNSATIARLPALLKELQKLGNLKIGAATAAELATVGRAFQNLAMIPANSAQRVNQVAAALNNLKINPQAGAALGPLSAALGAIKAPSTATVNNIAALIRTLSTGNVAQVNAMATALQRLNGLNLRAAAPAQPRPVVAPQPRVQPAPSGASSWFSNLTSGSGSATGAMRGLENQFNMTYQAASLFRTMIGSITLGEFSKAVLDAGNKVLGFKLSMDAIATAPQEAGEQFQFLIDMSNRTGTSLDHNIDAFTRFAAAARSLGTSVSDTQKIYESFSTAFAVMHVSAQRQNLAFLAIQEAFSKDQVQKQQAVRQLATELPGAVSIMSQALGMTTRQLEEHFKKGDLDPQEVFTKMADVLNQRFGTQLPEALKHSQASLNQLGNAFMVLKNSIFENGFDSGLSSMIKGFAGAINEAGIEDVGKRIGAAFQEIFTVAGALGQTLLDYAKPIGQFALALTGLMVANQAAGAMRMLLSPVALAGAAFFVTYEAVNSLGGGFSEFAGPAAIAASLLIGIGSTTLFIVSGFALAIESARLLGVALSHIIPQDWTARIQAGVNGLASQIDHATGGVFDLHGKRVAQGFDTPEGISDPDELKKHFDTSGEGAGKSFGDGLKSGLAASAEKLKSDLNNLSKGFSAITAGAGGAFSVGPLKTFSDHLADATKRAEELGKQFHGMADYAGNQAALDERAKRKLEDLTDEQEKLFKSVLKSQDALKTLREELALIDGMKGKKRDGELISDSQIEAFKRAAVEKALPDVNPAASEIQKLNGQLEEQMSAYQRASNGSISYANALEQEKAVLTVKNKLMKEGRDITDEDADAIRKMVGAMQEMKAGGNDALSQWVNSVKDFNTAMNEAAKNGIDKWIDAFSTIAFDGKKKFADIARSTAQSLAKEFISIGLKGLLAQALKGAGVGNLMGDMQSALGFGKKFVGDAIGKMAENNVAVQNVSAGVVNLTGATISGLPGIGGTGIAGSSMGQNVLGVPNSTSISDVNGGLLGGAANIASPISSESFNGIAPLAIAGGASVFGLGGFKMGTTGTSITNGLTTFGSQPLTGIASQVTPSLPTGISTLGSVSSFPMSISTATGTGASLADKLDATKLIKGFEGFQKVAKPDTDGVYRLGYGSSTSTDPTTGAFKAVNPGDSVNAAQAEADLSRRLQTEFIPKFQNQFGKDVWTKFNPNQQAALGSMGYNYGSVPKDVVAAGKAGDMNGIEAAMRRHAMDNPELAGKNGLPMNYDRRMKEADIFAGKRDVPKAPTSSGDITNGVDRARSLGVTDHGNLTNPEAVVFHHTGGRGSVDGTMQTLGQRHLGSNYIMDRDGNVTQIIPDGKAGAHIMPSDNFAGAAQGGLNNHNALGIEMIAKNNADLTEAQKAASVKFMEQMRSKYGDQLKAYGHGELNPGHKLPDEGMGAVDRVREFDRSRGINDAATRKPDLSNANPVKQRTLKDYMGGESGIDRTPTGSIGQVGQQADPAANQLKQAMKQSADQFKQAMTPATTQVGQSLTTNLKTATTQIGPQLTTALSPATGSLSQVTKGIEQMGQSSTGAVPGLDQIIQEISKLGSGGGGIGGILGGLFSEGGYSEHPVSHGSMHASAWHGAPHFSEGTANTSGGMPAVLHPNEAVIPLTRGRKIPVEMSGGHDNKEQSGNRNAPQITVNLQTKDQDSFRRNTAQLQEELMKQAGRLMARNG